MECSPGPFLLLCLTLHVVISKYIHANVCLQMFMTPCPFADSSGRALDLESEGCNLQGSTVIYWWGIMPSLPQSAL